MKKLPVNRRSLTLALVLLPLLAGFFYVATSSGPLAPVPVTVTGVRSAAISPSLFGIGIVEARYRYQIGPSITGKVLRLDVNVGDFVKAGQSLGEMDPVDMDNRIVAKKAAISRAEASVVAARAGVRDAEARADYARMQSKRYRKLAGEKSVSTDEAEAKYQEYVVTKASLAAAKANLDAARKELDMLRADHKGLVRQREQLKLTAPVDGLVVGRYIEAGSTALAGQMVLEIIKPESVWINVRFSQLQSEGLAKGLPARIVLRSRASRTMDGHVERIEPLADAVTEETLAKVVFDPLPKPLPLLGELAEVTVSLPALASSLVIPNASLKYYQGEPGVWLIRDNEPEFVRIRIGARDLDGRVQVIEGLEEGDRLVLYSQQELGSHSRIRIVDHLQESGHD